MKNNFGICVTNLKPSQLNADIINSCNEFCDQNKGSVIVFYEEVSLPCINPRFATMPISEIFGFDGTLITTNISTTEKSLKIPVVSDRIYYIWDLEWMRWIDYPNETNTRDFESLLKVYRSDTKKYTRNEDYAKLIGDMWNIQSPFPIGDFNIEKFVRKNAKN